jgi:hypothetical protein
MRQITSISPRRARAYAFISAAVLLATTIFMVSIREKEDPPLTEPEPESIVDPITAPFFRYTPIVDIPDVSDDEEIVEEPEIMRAMIVSEETFCEEVEVEEITYDVPLEEDLQNYIKELCEQFNVPIKLVYAIISVESDFCPTLISKTNDYGLMQINKVNHEWLTKKHNITDFLDPYQNVYCGILIFSQHYQRYQDIYKALMAYNMGANGAARAWDKGIYSTRYTTKIEKALGELESNNK